MLNPADTGKKSFGISNCPHVRNCWYCPENLQGCFVRPEPGLRFCGGGGGGGKGGGDVVVCLQILINNKVNTDLNHIFNAFLRWPQNVLCKKIYVYCIVYCTILYCSCTYL